MTQKIVNIIGGSGFIGTRLCQRLSEIDEIKFSIIDKIVGQFFPYVTKEADVRSYDELAKTIDEEAIIVNLAAEHRDDVRPTQLYYDVNVTGAKNICKVVKTRK